MNAAVCGMSDSRTNCSVATNQHSHSGSGMDNNQLSNTAASISRAEGEDQQGNCARDPQTGKTARSAGGDTEHHQRRERKEARHPPSAHRQPIPISTYPYVVTGTLGKGTYGVVYKATEPSGDSVALKIVTLENEMEGVPSTALREISTMQEICHPNVLRLLRVFSSPQALTVAFELADFDLKRYMDAYRCPLSSRRTKSFMYQLLEGLAHVHHLMILHRDIKPQNLLVFANGVIKLADFGLSRAFSVPVRDFAHEVVTLWYRPPDVLLGNQNYDTGVDMWSLGCVFAEMMECRPLFSATGIDDQLKRIFEVLGTPTEADIPNCTRFVEWKKRMKDIPVYPKMDLTKVVPHADPDALDLLKRLLVYDGKARISAQEALSHPYFTRSPFAHLIPLHEDHINRAKSQLNNLQRQDLNDHAHRTSANQGQRLDTR